MAPTGLSHRRPSVLVQRRHVIQFEAGARPFPPATGAQARLRPALSPFTAVTSVLTTDPVVGLTFDDGPDPASTPGVLDALRDAGAVATFFVLAGRAVAHPGLVRRILDEGHELGLHGDDHTRLSTLPAPRAAARILRARRRLESVAGRAVTLYRPAYGAQRLAQAGMTRAAGLTTVLWTAWARDWEGGPAGDIARRAGRAVHPGAIVLLHDSDGDWDAPPEAAERTDRAAMTAGIVRELGAAGYRTATVGALLAEHPAVRTLWFERASAARAAGDALA